MAHSFKLEIQFYFSYSRSGWQMKIKIVRFTCEFLSGFQLDLLQHRAIKALTVCDVSHPVGYNFVHVSVQVLLDLSECHLLIADI